VLLLLLLHAKAMRRTEILSIDTTSSKHTKLSLLLHLQRSTLSVNAVTTSEQPFG
jgi:hypothetical protein